MAMNPMQRKANNYLLIGVLVTLLITGSIIAMLFMQISKMKKQMAAQQEKIQTVFVVSKDIKSGSKVDLTNLKEASALKESIPSNALDTGKLTENTISKLDLKPGTILTENMVVETEEELTADIRIQEYNMIELQTQIQTGDYIDVRLRMPDGTDYIVVSKKKIEIPTINGGDSLNTIKIRVSEEEIMLMSNAIVEAYWAKGSKLYATTYVEPGNQANAIPTYVQSAEVINLINADKNITEEARRALVERYTQEARARRENPIIAIKLLANCGAPKNCNIK